MSKQQCLANLFDSGEISETVYKKAKKNIDSDDFIEEQIQKSKKKHDDNINDLSKKQILLDEIEVIAKKSQDDAIEFIEDKITKPKGMGKKTENIEYKAKQISGTVLAPLAKHFNALRSKMGGLKINKQLLDDITLGIYKATDISKPITKETQDIIKAMDEVRVEINKFLPDDKQLKSLGDLSPLTPKIQNMTYQQFHDIVKPLVKDNDTQIEKVYKQAIEGEEIGKMTFVNGDALAEYQSKIGGDPFSSLINFVDRQSAEIASKGVLGKFPENTIKRLAKKAGLDDSDTSRLVNMYQHASGNIKVQQNKGFSGGTAATISAARAVGTASMMGSSTLTAIMDLATMGITASFNGIPLLPMYGKMLKNIVSRGSRMELAQLGFQLESVMSALSATSRFNPHSTSSDALNKIATGVLRTSGLLAASDACKLAVKNSFLVTFKDFQKSTFNGLIKKNPRLRQQMKQYGITHKDWDVMRKFMGDDIKLNPLELTKYDNEVGSKFFRFINEEADYAVVTPGARSAYWTTLGKKKGTVEGETIKSLTQFKSTIVEQVTTHLYRAAMQQGAANKVAYASQYLVATSILGAMVHQLKEVAKGNSLVDPTEDPMAFAADVLREGGAVPMVTDTLIPNMMNPKFGQGGLESMLSPSSLNKPLRLASNIPGAVAGDEGSQRKLAQDAIGMLPGQNMWYLKAFVAYGKSYVGYLADPKGERKKQRSLERRLKKNGQEKILEL